MEDWGCDDSAFTEHELASGIRSIHGTSVAGPQRSSEEYNRAIGELVEFDSQVSLEALCADLVKSFISKEPAEIIVEYTDEADKVLGSNHGQIDQAAVISKPLNEQEYKYYCVNLRFQTEYWVSIRDFLTALKQTQIPAQVWGDWFIWDAASDRALQCVKISPCAIKPSLDTADEVSALSLEVVKRSPFTMDHGYKPMLVHCEDLPRLLDKHQVKTPNPSCLFESEMRDYSLAYFTSTGQICHIRLLNALTVTTYLATRGGTYSLCSGVLTPALNQAWLDVSAYQMARKMTDELDLKPRVFLRKSHASAFEAIFRNITLEEVNNYPKEAVFLTDGDHPLDISDKQHGCEWGSGLVTTYELYDQARKNLVAHGVQCLDLNQKWFDLSDNGSGIAFD
jgi:hypothetical protein